MRKTIMACAISGFGLSLNSYADAPKVAVDIAPLHSLVSQVMEGVSEPDLIIPAEASPHDYALRPSQATALAESEIVFWMGEELTPWLEKAIHNVAESAQKISVLELEGTTTYEFREGATFEKHMHDEEGHHGEGHHEEDHHEDGHHDEHAHHNEHSEHDEHKHDEHGHEPGLLDRFLAFFSHDHEGEHEHEHGDSHAHEGEHHDSHGDHDGHHDEHSDHHDEHGHHHEGVDPHAWLDPENAKVWVVEIKSILSASDPENAETYEANAAKASAELDRLIQETRDSVESLGDLKFVVFHDAYQYFEKRFGISAAGSISLGDAEDPSPARIKEIRDTVQELGVNCVFAEPQFDAGLVNNVFEGSSITGIGVMDPLGSSIEEGPSHYSKLIQGMASSLSECTK